MAAAIGHKVPIGSDGTAIGIAFNEGAIYARLEAGEVKFIPRNSVGSAPEAIAKSLGNKGHEIRFSKESYRLPFSRQAFSLQVLRALGLATSLKKILIADH